MDNTAQREAEPKNDAQETCQQGTHAASVEDVSAQRTKMFMTEPTNGPDSKDESDCATADRFVVKKYQAVGIWTWDLKIDTCAICHSHIMEQCIDCEANDSKEPCVPGWGTCGHCYHFHCISRWLKTREVCPLDNQEWNWAKLGS